MRTMKNIPVSAAAPSSAMTSQKLPACSAHAQWASWRGDDAPSRRRRTAITPVASTANASAATNSSAAWYMRVKATSAVTEMISSRPSTAGRGNPRVCASGGSSTTMTVLDREHDEQAEDEHDGEVRQAERAERAQRVPGDRVAPEHPAAQRGRAVPRRMYRDRGPDGHQPLLPVPAGNTGWTSAGSARTTRYSATPWSIRRQYGGSVPVTSAESTVRGAVIVYRVPWTARTPVAGGRQVAVPVDVSPVGERDGEAAGHRSRDDGVA